MHAGRGPSPATVKSPNGGQFESGTFSIFANEWPLAGPKAESGCILTSGEVRLLFYLALAK
jgi:hypothetical protein